jgi:hypothetical protein
VHTCFGMASSGIKVFTFPHPQAPQRPPAHETKGDLRAAEPGSLECCGYSMSPGLTDRRVEQYDSEGNEYPSTGSVDYI